MRRGRLFVCIRVHSWLVAWTLDHGAPPNLSGHGSGWDKTKGAWDTKDKLRQADGHGHGKLIQPGVCENRKGKEANLVIDLRTGLPQQMPKGGPFLDETAIQRIEDWINAGCPD